MDRTGFGKMVAALRQELGWTQSNLAQHTGLDISIVSQIERGVKKGLEPDLLICLADAFRLTTLERKAFFLASTGVGNEQIVRSPAPMPPGDLSTAEKSLNRMVGLVETLHVPAFLLDVYSDVLAINYVAFAFFQIPLELMADAPNIPGGLNAVRLVFGKDMVARSHFLSDWEYYAISTMRFFREASLCYRATPYFKYLMKAFQDPVEYPLFERYWRMVSSVEQDREGTYETFSYDHGDFGHLSYSVSTTVCVTTHGDLLLNQYNPTDSVTKALFDQLVAQNGTGVIPVAPWPEKQMP